MDVEKMLNLHVFSVAVVLENSKYIVKDLSLLHCIPYLPLVPSLHLHWPTVKVLSKLGKRKVKHASHLGRVTDTIDADLELV